MSQFDLEIEYLPGDENVVADAMSRWAYPATSAKQDVSWHGSQKAKHGAQDQQVQEFQESRALLVILKEPKKLQLVGVENGHLVVPFHKVHFGPNSVFSLVMQQINYAG